MAIETNPRHTFGNHQHGEGVLFELPYDNGRRQCLVSREILEELDEAETLDGTGQFDAYQRHIKKINAAADAQIFSGDGHAPIILQFEFLLGLQ